MPASVVGPVKPRARGGCRDGRAHPRDEGRKREGGWPQRERSHRPVAPARVARRGAPDRVEKIKPHYTSQRCSACGHVDGKSRESQAVFQCTACGFAGNADVNAARNIAAGHAVTARGGCRDAGPVNREPQLLTSLAGCE